MEDRVTPDPREIRQVKDREDLSRMGTTGQSIDSRTASSVTPTATDGKKEPKNFPFGIERTDAADTCGGCGGPYAFDTTVPSAVWNRVVRPLGISEYLCLGCVVRIFAERGESFTAKLWGKQEAFNGLPIRVSIGASAEVVSPSQNVKAPVTIGLDCGDVRLSLDEYDRLTAFDLRFGDPPLHAPMGATCGYLRCLTCRPLRIANGWPIETRLEAAEVVSQPPVTETATQEEGAVIGPVRHMDG